MDNFLKSNNIDSPKHYARLYKALNQTYNYQGQKTYKVMIEYLRSRLVRTYEVIDMTLYDAIIIPRGYKNFPNYNREKIQYNINWSENRDMFNKLNKEYMIWENIRGLNIQENYKLMLHYMAINNKEILLKLSSGTSIDINTIKDNYNNLHNTDYVDIYGINIDISRQKRLFDLYLLDRKYDIDNFERERELYKEEYDKINIYIMIKINTKLPNELMNYIYGYLEWYDLPKVLQ